MQKQYREIRTMPGKDSKTRGLPKSKYFSTVPAAPGTVCSANEYIIRNV